MDKKELHEEIYCRFRRNHSLQITSELFNMPKEVIQKIVDEQAAIKKAIDFAYRESLEKCRRLKNS